MNDYERGFGDGQREVLDAIQRHLPAAESDFIESLVTPVDRGVGIPEAPLRVSTRARALPASLSTDVPRAQQHRKVSEQFQSE